MLVICCGMMRAGSTLQYHLTTSLVEELGLGLRGGNFSEYDLPDFLRTYQPSNQITVIKCHEYVPEVAKVAQHDQVKAVYIYRDVRDVVVSMMNRDQKPFLRLVRNLPASQIRQYHYWTNFPEVLISVYETIYQNLPLEVTRIAAFLGIHIDPAITQTIAQKYSLDAQRRRIATFDYQSNGVTDRDGQGLYDPNTHMHIRHIGTAQPRQWESKLSSWQVALIEAKTYAWLVDRGYGISQPYAKHLLARTLYMPLDVLGTIYSYTRRKWFSQ
jgi:hypothetical protein